MARATIYDKPYYMHGICITEKNSLRVSLDLLKNDSDIYIVLQIMPNRNPDIHYSLLYVQTIRKHFLNINLNDVNHSIFRKTQ